MIQFGLNHQVVQIWKLEILFWWVVVSNILYVYPYLGKIPILTHIFQMGWNHQLDFIWWVVLNDVCFEKAMRSCRKKMATVCIVRRSMLQTLLRWELPTSIHIVWFNHHMFIHLDNIGSSHISLFCPFWIAFPAGFQETPTSSWTSTCCASRQEKRSNVRSPSDFGVLIRPRIWTTWLHDDQPVD